MRELGGPDNEKRSPSASRRQALSPAFRMAVLAGAVESVRVHLRAGTDIDAADTQGRSPLILAASRGQLEVCRLLLEAGADPTIKDTAGNDARAIALARGDAAVADLLHRGRVSVALVRDDRSDANRSRADGGPFNGRALERMEATPEKKGEVGAPRGSGVGNPIRNDERATGDENEFAPPPDENDVLDLSGWQEEVETEAPPDDVSSAIEAAALQEELSRHSPIDTDENWDDVEICKRRRKTRPR